MERNVPQAADVVAVGAGFAAATVERFGRANLLVNNAGAFVASLAWETPEAQLDWIIDLNVKNVAHGIRAFVPRLGEQIHSQRQLWPADKPGKRRSANGGSI